MQKSDSKSLFKAFSEDHHKEMLFSQQYSWWSEVVKDNWDVAIHSKGSKVQAVWPYYIRQKGPWKMIAQAPLSPYSGPCIIYPEGQKPSTRISFENNVYTSLLKQLPNVAEIALSFPVSFTNGLAFLWDGFQQHSRYTYVLSLQKSEKELWQGFRENIRREIRKAEKNLQTKNGFKAEILEQLISQSFKNKNETNPIAGTEWIKRFTAYLINHQCGEILLASTNEEIHAGLGIIYDNKTAYYLLGGAATEHKNSGAISLLMWQAIKNAKAAGKIYFNFEGSSIPSIEKYLRGFGGELFTFPRLVKTSSKSYELLKGLKT